MSMPKEDCAACSGSGAGPWEAAEDFGQCNQGEPPECEECHGEGTLECQACCDTGKVVCPWCFGNWEADPEDDKEECTNCTEGEIVCPKCYGEKERCGECDGEGSIPIACIECHSEIPYLGTYYSPKENEVLCASCFEVEYPRPACAACEGTGLVAPTWPCPTCAGAGRRMPAGALPELYRKEAWVCPSCTGSGRVPRPIVILQGKKYRALEGRMDCSCCGGAAHYPGDEATRVRGLGDYHDDYWFVFRAGMCDTDGTYYARLCGDAEGLNGCLVAVADEQDEIPLDLREAIAIARELMPGEEDDGIITTIEDYIESTR